MRIAKATAHFGTRYLLGQNKIILLTFFGDFGVVVWFSFETYLYVFLASQSIEPFYKVPKFSHIPHWRNVENIFTSLLFLHFLPQFGYNLRARTEMKVVSLWTHFHLIFYDRYFSSGASLPPMCEKSNHCCKCLVISFCVLCMVCTWSKMWVVCVTLEWDGNVFGLLCAQVRGEQGNSHV